MRGAAVKRKWRTQQRPSYSSGTVRGLKTLLIQSHVSNTISHSFTDGIIKILMTGRKGREKTKDANASQYSYLQKLLNINWCFLHDSSSKQRKALYECREVSVQCTHTYAKMHTKNRCISVHGGIFCAHKESEHCSDGEKEELTGSFQVKQEKKKSKINRSKLHPSLQWASIVWIILIQLYQ